MRVATKRIISKVVNNNNTQGLFENRSFKSRPMEDFCALGGWTRSLVEINVMKKKITAAMPNTVIVNCQPRASLPFPKKTVRGSAKADTMVPLI